jgi:hypothetical protein
MVPHAGFDPTTTTLSFAAFERYTISKHHRRSITGLQFPTSGNMPLGSSRISRRKHKHLYPRRFPESPFSGFLFGKHQKASRYVCGYALKTWDYGLMAFLNSCLTPFPFLFSLYRTQHGFCFYDGAAVNSGWLSMTLRLSHW